MRALPPIWLVAVLAAACAVNPVTKRPEVTLLSTADEKELGAEQARIVANSIGIFHDERLTAYVAEVGARVAARSPRRDVTYVFQVLDADEPNAFALPGGTVYVSRGLLALLESEDELAGVLGHEIAHVAAKHAAQRVSRAAPIGVLTGIGAAVTGIVSPVLASRIAGAGIAANEAVLAPYGRTQELEADRIGVAMAAGAGYDPAALSRALASLTREEQLRGDDARRDWYATHPPLPRREEDAAAEAARARRRDAGGVPAPARRPRDRPRSRAGRRHERQPRAASGARVRRHVPRGMGRREHPGLRRRAAAPWPATASTTDVCGPGRRPRHGARRRLHAHRLRRQHLSGGRGGDGRRLPGRARRVRAHRGELPPDHAGGARPYPRHAPTPRAGAGRRDGRAGERAREEPLEGRRGGAPQRRRGRREAAGRNAREGRRVRAVFG
jgi:Zn-dependent protease with chaperone function